MISYLLEREVRAKAQYLKKTLKICLFSEQKLMEATLATAVATATVLVNDAAVRYISGNVTLTFKHNAGKGKVPSCVFLQKNGEM